MKILLRVIVLNYLFIMIGSHFFMPSFTIDPSKGMTSFDWIVYIWAFIFIFGSFFWGAYMLYHWGVNTFSSRTWKVAWFFVVLLGIPLGFLGPLLYYIVVYELHKGGIVRPVS